MGEPKMRREDVHTTTSELKGVGGYVETFIRRFRTLSFVILLTPLLVVCLLTVGIALGPGLYVFHTVSDFTSSWPEIFRYMGMGIGMSLGFFTYGVTLTFLVPLVNFLVPFKPKPFRGPWYSLAAVPWYFHNGLTYMVRYTFLDFVTPTPLNILFYKMMGMKIGKGVVINTTYISDPCMITMGDFVTVGGSATIFAHYGQKGYLIVAPVTIGSGTNIGLKASIMGGCTVGQNVTIKPHAVLLPKTQVGDGETV